MTFVPHIRMSLLGYQGGAPGVDIFSMNLALAPVDPGAFTAIGDWQPNDTVWDDFTADAVAWFGSQGARIRNYARLTRVKFAYIGADGRYTRPAIERAVDQAGEGSVGPVYPFQTALAVTLGTDGDLQRVKGRIFQPAPALSVDSNTGLVDDAGRDAVRAAADDFLTNLGNQPGIDTLDLRVVVASQGRRNPDGSIRVAPANHPVTRVNVGRVLDTMRSRRSALGESPEYQGVDQA